MSDLQSLWDSLGAPLDLVEKGKYGAEKGLSWKWNELKRDFDNSGDESFWAKGRDNINDIFNQGLHSDHTCQPDHNFRCKICGKILKQVIYGNVSIFEPYNIFYYNYEYIVQFERRKSEILCKNFTEITNLIKQRELTLFLLYRPQGLGYFDFQQQKKNQMPKQIENFQYEGDKQSKNLEFYADFEGANMSQFILHQNLQYVKIILKSDTNTLGFTQWFNFGVKFWGDKPESINIQIVNCRKKTNLFTQGMKFYIGYVDYEKGIKWEKYPHKIEYKQSQVRRKNPKHETEGELPLSDYFYTLKFQHTFAFQGERLIFSYQKPYTFTDLIFFLEKIEHNMKAKGNLTEEFNQRSRSLNLYNEDFSYKKEIVGGSRLGLSIFLIEITNGNRKLKLPYDKRKVIFFTGRQIPVETPSSLIIEGLIQFLISDDLVAQKLREFYIIKIAPMINPDGVSIGNSRTNISGSDLNREWDNPQEKLHPEIYYLKNHMKKFLEKRELFMFIDLHATSNEKNAFFYGCEQASGLNDSLQWFSNRLFMKIMHESMNYFNYEQCKISLKKKNMPTARGVFWVEFKSKFSFNFDVSFFGFFLNSYFQIQSDRLNEKKKLIKQLEQGIIDYDQYMEIKDAILEKAGDNHQQNEEHEIQEFTEQSYISMGSDIALNILKFTLMYQFMVEESQKNNGELQLVQQEQQQQQQTKGTKVQKQIELKVNTPRKQNTLNKQNSSIFSRKDSNISQVQKKKNTKTSSFFNKLKIKLNKQGTEDLSMNQSFFSQENSYQNTPLQSALKQDPNQSLFLQEILNTNNSNEQQLQKSNSFQLNRLVSEIKNENNQNMKISKFGLESIIVTSSPKKKPKKNTFKKKKVDAFLRNVLQQTEEIKNLFPNMRSFQWRDYFSQEEFDNQFSEQAIEEKIIHIINNDLDTAKDYDTDSQPENDLIDPKLFIDELDCYYDGENPEDRRRKLQEIYDKFGDKYKGLLKNLNMEDLELLLRGELEIDENGNIIRKNVKKDSEDDEQRRKREEMLRQKSSAKGRKDSSKDQLSNQNKTEGNKEDDDEANLSNKNLLDDYWFSKFRKTQSKADSNSNDLFFQTLSNDKNQQGRNSWLIRNFKPKSLKIKLKNPFIPSPKKILDIYQFKNLKKLYTVKNNTTSSYQMTTTYDSNFFKPKETSKEQITSPSFRATQRYYYSQSNPQGTSFRISNTQFRSTVLTKTEKEKKSQQEEFKKNIKTVVSYGQNMKDKSIQMDQEDKQQKQCQTKNILLKNSNIKLYKNFQEIKQTVISYYKNEKNKQDEIINQ